MELIETAVRPQSGPAVCRGDELADLIEVVSARFPIARRLVGEASFDAVLRAFAAVEPPGSPVLADYGDAFPQFLRRLGRDACINYIADIAELEAGLGKAYRAADAEAVPAGTFAETESLADLRLSLHPSVVLVQSRFPIVSVWRASQNIGDTPLREWRAEAALVARPQLDVEVRCLPPGGFGFLTQLSRGSTIARSAEAAAHETPDFDLDANLSLLLDANIVIACW